MNWKRKHYSWLKYTVMTGLCRVDIDLTFRHYIRMRNKKSRHDYKLTAQMKRDYISYYKSFGFKHIHTDWLNYVYGITGKYDRRYVPDDIFTKFIDYPYSVNRVAWQNKGHQPKILDGVRFPETIVKRENGFYLNKNDEIINAAQALTVIRENDEVVLKPSIGGAGVNIKFFKSSEITEEIFSQYNGDFIAQKVIAQSDLMKKFGVDYVSILKITSFYFHGKVHILSARVWGGESKKRTSNAGTYVVAVNSDGVLSQCAFDEVGNRVECMADGTKFSDIRLGFYDECVDIIRRGHEKLLYFPFISWDFTQDQSGNTILIEYNLKWHTLYEIQLLSGPVFGDLTDDVLKEAAANINKRDFAEF